jgi:hypothetical protein
MGGILGFLYVFHIELLGYFFACLRLFTDIQTFSLIFLDRLGGICMIYT